MHWPWKRRDVAPEPTKVEVTRQLVPDASTERRIQCAEAARDQYIKAVKGGPSTLREWWGKAIP